MDRYQLRQFGDQMRNSLLSNRSKEFGVFLFFFVVATGFWILQTLDETFETEVLIPMELTDVPEEVVITTPLPDHLTVTVRDKGAVLVRYWNADIQPISLSFPQYDTGLANGHVRITQSEIQKAVNERLISTSKVQTIHPDTIEFYYNHGLHGTRPVQVTGNVETSPHFYLLDVTVNPSEVTVYAPAATLDTMTSVQTIPLHIKDLSENVTRKVRLRPIRGAKIEPAEVEVTALVDVYMENTIENIPVVSLNFPADIRLQTFPATIKVTYTIGYSRSKEVTRRNFVPAVTYEDILDLQGKGLSKIPVRLKSIPDGVTNVRIEPRELDYLLESVKEEN